MRDCECGETEKATRPLSRRIAIRRVRTRRRSGRAFRELVDEAVVTLADGMGSTLGETEALFPDALDEITDGTVEEVVVRESL